MLRGYHASGSISGPSYRELATKLGIAVLLKMEPTNELVTLVENTLRGGLLEFSEFYARTKDSPIWHKMESLGFSRNQQTVSAAILLAVTQANILR